MNICLLIVSLYFNAISVKSQFVQKEFNQCELTCVNDGYYSEPVTTNGQKGEIGKHSQECKSCPEIEKQLLSLLQKFQKMEENHSDRIKSLENQIKQLSIQLETLKITEKNQEMKLEDETNKNSEDEIREFVVVENSNITKLNIETLNLNENIEEGSETANSKKETSQQNLATDCQAIKNLDPSAKSGVYIIQLSEAHSSEVFCEMTSLYYGWTVIQRRINGSVNFHRGWNEYEKGFGPKDGEHWIGLKSINELTRKVPTTLRIELTNFDDETRWVEYSLFYVDEGPFYKLSFEGYSGNAGDSLGIPESMHRGQSFSTHDRDNDLSIANCAKVLDGGGWWFAACHRANLNGEYHTPKSYNKYQGIIWYTWGGWDQPLKGTKMMVRPMIVH